PDWGYNLNTHQSNTHMAWHYARGTPLGRGLADGTRRWYEWFGYNAVPEPNDSALTLNRAVETRQRRSAVAEAGPEESETGNPLAEVVEAARVLGPTREGLARRRAARRADLERRWPRVDSLAVGAFRAFSPYAFLHRSHVRWYPGEQQRRDAVAALRHQRETRFTHQRTDGRKAVVFSYVRRPAYYAAFTAGETATAQQRYGLGLLWVPGAGSVLQSQTDGLGTAWGTRPAAADTARVYEAASFGAAFRVGAGVVTPAPGNRDLPAGEYRIEYRLGGHGAKTVVFRELGLHVAVEHAGAFVEQLPLLLLPSDSLSARPGLVELRRGAAWVALRWAPATSARVERTAERSGGRRVVAVAIPATGALTYDIEIHAAASSATLMPPAGGLLTRRELARIERGRVLAAARRYLREPPVTITAFRAERSAGGPHDFYSEGDYWWPDPLNPGGPYVRRDGETNPDNFVAHRDAMRRLSQIVPALVAAYQLTGDARYARQAVAHLRAWFVAERTRMNPNLLYGQAIKGVATGRGIGIIDTIHLVEVARAVSALERAGYVGGGTVSGVKDWFRQYLEWMTTHPYGIAERDNGNNHSAAWALQVAEFARLVGDTARLASTRAFFKETLVPQQMAADGSFPKELARTKPYGYSLFQLDVMATLAEVLSTPGDDLWRYEAPDGRGMRRALAFMYPFIKDKRSWPKAPDVMYHDQWPVRHPALLFGGRALGEARYVELWKTLPADPTVDEVIRNYPIRQPLLWVRE
ncbi:MAG TPA: alginate lyase family protein, partial [Gemmatimonadaceae bacterium]|nr:alginate lyase family protein [Gemmatimonadaceae bacterium]